jgi:hypothetical protein
MSVEIDLVDVRHGIRDPEIGPAASARQAGHRHPS